MPKKNVEKQFDAIFSANTQAAYRFDPKSLGLKDRRIVEFLRKTGVSGKACLDVGPGTGRWLTFLKEEGASRLVGADISEESLKRCRALCDETQKLDLEKDRLDFPDDAFDLIVSFEVLEHLFDPTLFMGELTRVARPGATLLMSVPNLASFISRIRLLVGGLPPAISQDPTHVRHYRQKDVTALFRRFGLVPRFLPTSFSLDPRNPKSRLRLPSSGLCSGLDDSLVFYAVTAGAAHKTPAP